jgi:hypothetical protein
MLEEVPVEPSADTNGHKRWEEEEEEEEDYDEVEDDDDEDINAEAEEIARRLGEQLWADISKGTVEQPLISSETEARFPATPHSFRKGEEAVVSTMRTILALAEDDPIARTTLASTAVPNLGGVSVFDILRQSVTCAHVAKEITSPLSQILVTLAMSECLFGNLRNSEIAAHQLESGKRKREKADEGGVDFRSHKRPYVADNELQTSVTEAVQIICQALGTSVPQALDPTFISSIRLPLHQAFLFAVTSSAAGGPEMHALQEISGLIQVIGVLSGIQIGQPSDSTNIQLQQPFPQGPAYPRNTGKSLTLATDIGTAVYPCLVASCKKVFSRLYSLRAHQRSHAVERPYRCSVCPASFARNHDLKRHIKLHDKKAWKCGGCQKVFSRRDAIKRHKNGGKNRGPKTDVCLAADIAEVELEERQGEDLLRDERRAKLWNGMAVSHTGVSSFSAPFAGYGEHAMEEGQIHPAVIAQIQGSVMSLHGLLQAYVGHALGTGHPVPPLADPAAGQATLASVIARAQSQNLPTANLPADSAGGAVTRADHVPATLQPTEEIAGSSTDEVAENGDNDTVMPSLSMYGLSDEQTKLLELAIANAASAAQAQAEAEAALEEEEDYFQDDEDYDQSDGEANVD